MKVGLTQEQWQKSFYPMLLSRWGRRCFLMVRQLIPHMRSKMEILDVAAKIAATSIVQGGPAPRFLDETTYNMLVKPEIDMTSLNMEKHFTANDQELFQNIKKDVNSHQDFILENGYTGIIDASCKDDIIGTIMVSIICR